MSDQIRTKTLFAVSLWDILFYIKLKHSYISTKTNSGFVTITENLEVSDWRWCFSFLEWVVHGPDK